MFKNFNKYFLKNIPTTISFLWIYSFSSKAPNFEWLCHQLKCISIQYHISNLILLLTELLPKAIQSDCAYQTLHKFCYVPMCFSSIFLHSKSEMVFCYQNCSDLLWKKNVLVIEKNFWNSRLKAENYNPGILHSYQIGWFSSIFHLHGLVIENLISVFGWSADQQKTHFFVT